MHNEISHGTTDSGGILIAFQEYPKFKILNDYRDTDGCILILKCIIEDSPYLLINFYNANRLNEQLKALKNLNSIISGIELESDTTIIFGGDFNIIYHIKLDADGGSPSLKLSCVSELEYIKKCLNLWRLRSDLLNPKFGNQKSHFGNQKSALL